MRRIDGMSVVVLCHDYGRFLGEALASVLDQEEGTVPLLEVLVVDDGSTDDTAEVAAAWAAADRRVRVLRHTVALGAVGAANAGLEQARGSHVLVLDADDRLGPGYLAACAAALERTGADVAYGSERRFGAETGTTVARPFDAAQLRIENQVYKPALLRATLLDRGLRFDARFEHLGQEDWVLWLDAVAVGARFVAVPDVWLEYRRHEVASRNTMSRWRAARVHLALWRTRPDLVRPRHVVARVGRSASRNTGAALERGRDLGTRAGGQAGGLLLQAVVFAVVARTLDAPGFTAFVAVSAVLALAAAVAELGLQTTTTIRVLRAPHDRDAITAAAVTASLAVGAVVLVVALPIALAAAGGSRGWTMLLALAPAFVVRRILLALEGVALGLEAWARVACSRVVTPIVAIAAMLALGAADRSPVAAVGVGLVAGELAGLVILAARVVLPRAVPTGRAVWSLVRDAAPLGAIGALSLLHNRLDQPLLGLLGARGDLASYAVAYRPVDAGASVLGAMSVVVLARVVTGRSPSDTGSVRRAALLAAVAGAALALALVALRGPVTVALAGDQGPAAEDYLLLLAPALVLFSVLAVVNQHVIAAGRTGPLLRLVAGCAVGNLALNLWLIPTVGAAGAGISTLVTGAVNVAGSLRLAAAAPTPAAARPRAEVAGVR